MSHSKEPHSVIETGLPVTFSMDSMVNVEPAPCQGCCSNRDIALTPADVVILSDAFGIGTGRLIHEGLILSETGAFLRKQVNGDCLFYRGGTCEVFDVRPLACRLFPFRNVSLPGDEPEFTLIDDQTRADGRTMRMSGFLADSDALRVMAFADRYTWLFLEMQNNPVEQAGNEPAPEIDQLLPLMFDADRMTGTDARQDSAHAGPEQKIDSHIAALRQLIAGEVGPRHFPESSLITDTVFSQAIGYSHCAWPVMRKGFYSPDIQRAAGPDGRAGLIVSLLDQMKVIQHWPAERIRKQQFRQIRKLVAHFRSTSPWYGRRLEEAGCPAPEQIDEENFNQLPVLTRTDFQDAGEVLYSTAPPHDHGELNSFTTSGSTGKPVTIRATTLADALHWASFIRNDMWHSRDFSGKFAYIQAYRDLGFAAAPEGASFEAWNEVFDTGPLVKLNVASSTLEQQMAWLQREQPAYLMSFPSSLEALARQCIKHGEPFPWLENVSTIGEQLSPAQREVMQKAWGKPVCETYGCAEATYIAFQSPASERLLVQSESVYVEILDDNDEPCPAGVPGRVVVTTLHNFATPVIRYEVGDLAVWGNPEEGFGLPVIEYVLGRSRNAIRLPNGEKAFPLRWSEEMGRIAPVRQWQMIQKSYTKIEVSLVVERPLSKSEEREILAAFSRVLGDGFQLYAKYVETIPRSASGKFEEFRCEIAE